MAAGPSAPSGPDLTQGVPVGIVGDNGNLLGHVGDEAVLLARRGDEYFAIGATCTHYSGPLAEGLMVGDTVRCPWHHACFSLRTGEALEAPAFNSVGCWRTEVRDGKVYVRDFDSTNGTFVNDQPVKGEVELHHDDKLKIGPLLFAVRIEESQLVAVVETNDTGVHVELQHVPGAAGM